MKSANDAVVTSTHGPPAKPPGLQIGIASDASALACAPTGKPLLVPGKPRLDAVLDAYLDQRGEVRR
jgi:hypothetical protein